METLLTIHDKDVGSITTFPASFRTRTAARALVLDSRGCIPLAYVSKGNYHKLPGGGVEMGESIEQGLAREVREEAGCGIKNIRPVGKVEEYRAQFSELQISHMFVAQVDGGRGTPEFDAGEQALGFSVKWLPLQTALEQLKQDAQNATEYEIKFMTKRDYTLLTAATKLL